MKVAKILNKAVRKAVQRAAERVQQNARRNILQAPFGRGSTEKPLQQAMNVRGSIAKAIRAKAVGDKIIVYVEGSEGGLSTVARDNDPLPLAPLIELGFLLTHAFYGRRRYSEKWLDMHPFLIPALEDARQDIEMIVGRAAAATIKQYRAEMRYGWYPTTVDL